MQDAELGGRLRVVRQLRGIKQADLAQQIGFDPAVVSNVEAGKRGPSLKMLKAICRALLVSSDYLLGLSESPLP